MSKPKFDPSKPFEATKPKFDPSKPVDSAGGVKSGSFDLSDPTDMERAQRASAAPARKAAPMSPFRSAAIGVAQGGTFGFADELAGLLGKLAMGEGVKLGPASHPAPDDTPEMRSLKTLMLAQEKTRPTTYEMTRDIYRGEDAAAREAHPWLHLAGNVAGGAAATWLGGRALGAAPGLAGALQATRMIGPMTRGQSLLRAMRNSSLAGAAGGAAYGAGASESDEGTGVALDSLGGGVGGALLGGAAPPIAGGLGWLARNIGAPVVRFMRGGYINPTPEAQRLLDKGAQMSLGQMEPGGTFARFEEAAANNALGNRSARVRAATGDSLRDLILGETRAAGAARPTAGTAVRNQVAQLQEGFGQLYDDALEGVRIQPDVYEGAGKWRGFFTDKGLKGSAKTRGAFELAAEGVKDASSSVKKRALAWLADQAEANGLRPAKSGAGVGTVEARSVQAFRTKLRDKISGLGEEGDDRAFREIYGRAEDFVTELLEGQLPPKNAEALRAADSTYRNLSAVKEAAKRAYVQEERFTPGQLLMSARSGRGLTPELERVAYDANAVLQPTYPKTGALPGSIENLLALKYLGPMFADFANASPALQRHATRPFVPGAITNAITATGRGAEAASMSPTGTSAAFRSLYDLLRAQDERPSLGGAP